MRSQFKGLVAATVACFYVGASFAAQAQTGSGPDTASAPTTLYSGPVFATVGEHLLLCAASLAGGQAAADIVDGFTGVALASKILVLPALGTTKPPPITAGTEPPDPCLSFVVPDTLSAAPGAIGSLFIARIVALNPQPLPPGSALNPQPLPPGLLPPYLEVYTQAPGGEISNVRVFECKAKPGTSG